MEVWKDIAGYEGLYQVSSFGRVKSLWHGRERIRKPHLNHKGYSELNLCKGGNVKGFKVHRLVAEAFIPNPQNKREVNHINGIKADNRVENLEWVTPSENQLHAYNTGLRKSAEENFHAKLTNEQVAYIRENPCGLSNTELAERFGVAQPTICNIQLGKTYQTVGGKVREQKYSRITENVRAEIKRLYIKGSSEFGSRALAHKFGISPSAVLKIVRENQ